jgi:hypothetical protein
MKAVRMAAVLLFAATPLLAGSNPAQPSTSGAQHSFDLMKSLVGNWEGKTSMGDSVHVSYRLIAADSALMSEIQGEMGGHSEDMITMIHMDGVRLLLTHYCPMGNQPRMKASASSDGRSVSFDFLDATNLASPEAGHMHSVTFTFVDATHHTEEWHFLDHGKERVEKFALQKKS